MSDLFQRDHISGAFNQWLIALMFLMKQARRQKSVVGAH
jgi:hypothetical protein